MKRLFLIVGFTSVLVSSCHSPIQTADPGALSATLEAPLSIDAGHSEVPFTYLDSIAGTGTENVGSIQISGNVGQVEINHDTYATFIQTRIQWDSIGQILYQGMALNSRNWIVYWVYCENGQITEIYYENADSNANYSETASGTCGSTLLTTPASVAVETPAMQISPAAPVQGFSIQGTGISLESGQTGELEVGDSKYRFLPFNTVDCSQCPSDSYDGWYELHSLLWNETSGQACFAIFYLFPNAPTEIKMNYSLCLPSMERPFDGLTLSAHWTKPI